MQFSLIQDFCMFLYRTMVSVEELLFFQRFLLLSEKVDLLCGCLLLLS